MRGGSREVNGGPTAPAGTADDAAMEGWHRDRRGGRAARPASEGDGQSGTGRSGEAGGDLHFYLHGLPYSILSGYYLYSLFYR